MYVEVDGDEPSTLGLVFDLDELKPKLIQAWHRLVWLPSVDDVLAMLGGAGIRVALEGYGNDWSAVVQTGPALDAEGPTPLIALLELLRAVEGKE